MRKLLGTTKETGKEVVKNAKNAVRHDNLYEKRKLLEKAMSVADPDLKELYRTFREVSNDIFKTYLPIISDKYYPISLEGPYKHDDRIRLLKIDKWVTMRTR